MNQTDTKMITEAVIRETSKHLFSAALRKVPEDTKSAIASAIPKETSIGARKLLKYMLKNAITAEERDVFVCSDSGVPVYLLEIGGRASWQGDLKKAIVDGFAELVDTISPPILKHVSNPLTNERSYAGRGMPMISVELIDGAEYIDLTCSPKALGSGRWTGIETFITPSLADIEAYVMDVVIKAGQQICPPFVIGIGIGGSFDIAAKLATKATYRELGSVNQEPILAAMEDRLLEAINSLGYGPMGTGGDTTALAVHADYSYGHGYTPVAVSFNCWINRKTKARFHNDGRIERLF